MAETGRGVERELEASVRRIVEALEGIPAARVEEVAARVSRAAETVAAEVVRVGGRAVKEIDRAVAGRPTREERQLAKKLREEEEASRPHAFAFGIAAVVAAGIAITQPQLFWLFFVAFGFAMGAADTMAKVRRHERRQAEEAQARFPEPVVSTSPVPGVATVLVSPPPAPPAAAESPVLAAITARERRLDGICDRLLGELKDAPPLVRELLRRPEETVEALRAASRELARRERGLRASLTEEEGERLSRERSELAARVEASPDAVVRERLAGALSALDAQVAHRAEIATAAARIEAEGTRILYSLESLRAQVLRAFAADSAASEGTRESLQDGLESLRAEIDAVATALEEVHGVVSPTSSTGGGPSAAARASLRQAAGR